MNRRRFLKALIAVPAVASVSAPVIETSMQRMARLYREGAMLRQPGFDWYQTRYIQPAIRQLVADNDALFVHSFTKG